MATLTCNLRPVHCTRVFDWMKPQERSWQAWCENWVPDDDGDGIEDDQ